MFSKPVLTPAVGCPSFVCSLSASTGWALGTKAAPHGALRDGHSPTPPNTTTTSTLDLDPGGP